MEKRNLFWGVLLVAIGALFILDNLDLINFSFSALVGLWPLLLVVWGISLLPMKPTYKTAAGLIIVFGALVYASSSDRESWWERKFMDKFDNAKVHFNKHHDNNEEDSDEDTFYTFQFDEELDSKITNAKLEMDVAAGKFRIEEPSNDHLVDFEAYSNIGPYIGNVVSNGDHADINISMEDSFVKNGTNRNRASIKLNPNILWDLNFDIGAADFRGDFEKFKVSKIDIDGGASSIRIKIGNLQKETFVKLDAGAASIKFEIPKNAGCKVNSESFLVDMDLDGFTKTENGDYITDNYNESDQKITIDIDAAISQLTVTRY